MDHPAWITSHGRMTRCPLACRSDRQHVLSFSGTGDREGAGTHLFDFRMLVRYLYRNSLRFIPAVKHRSRMRPLAIRLREQSRPCRHHGGIFTLLWRREAMLHIDSHAIIMSCRSQTIREYNNG
jgi:hypothetical protein